MRRISAAAITAFTLTLAFTVSSSATAQSESTQHRKIFGYQDVETGDFHPLPRVDPEVTGAASPTTGSYQVTFNITLKSSFPSGTRIGCEIVVDETSLVTVTTPVPSTSLSSYTETAESTVAAGAAGSKVTCVADLPYSWIIPASAGGTTVRTTVGGSYSVSAIYASGTGTTTATVKERSSSSQLAISTKVPATGSTTSLTVNATL